MNEFAPRNDEWLKLRLETIWRRYFSDIAQKNSVFVKFGRRARTRLGSIKYGSRLDKNTYITITGYFRDPTIPEFVVDAVLAHELSHYAHGFFSPHDQQHRHPHLHGVVDKELTARGLADTLKLQKRWLKLHWRDYIINYRS